MDQVLSDLIDVNRMLKDTSCTVLNCYLSLSCIMESWACSSEDVFFEEIKKLEFTLPNVSIQQVMHVPQPLPHRRYITFKIEIFVERGVALFIELICHNCLVDGYFRGNGRVLSHGQHNFTFYTTGNISAETIREKLHIRWLQQAYDLNNLSSSSTYYDDGDFWYLVVFFIGLLLLLLIAWSFSSRRNRTSPKYYQVLSAS